MFQNQTQTHNRHDHHRTPVHATTSRSAVARAVVISVAAGVAAVAMGAGPAAARPDPGPVITPATHAVDLRSSAAGDGSGCDLARVGTQYVKCDDNTGNGVPAPAWIPER